MILAGSGGLDEAAFMAKLAEKFVVEASLTKSPEKGGIFKMYIIDKCHNRK